MYTQDSTLLKNCQQINDMKARPKNKRVWNEPTREPHPRLLELEKEVQNKPEFKTKQRKQKGLML